jgi:hypothetical protein
MPSLSAGRWLAALALTVPAVLAFNSFYFVYLGSLVIPLAAYAAAGRTGYARRDAVAVAAGSGVFIPLGMWVGSGLSPGAVTVYAVVVAVAIRPPDIGTACFRVVTLASAVLLAHSLDAWWVALFIPLLVAVTDEAVDRLGSERALEDAEAVEDRRSSRPADRALAAASLSCLLLVSVPLLGGFQLGVLPGALGLLSAATGAVFAVSAFREDPGRASAALALSAVPLVVLGFLALIYLSGGIDIGN